MDETRRLSRRALLTGLCGIERVATGGCLDNGNTGMDRETSQTEGSTEQTTTDRQTDTPAPRPTINPVPPQVHLTAERPSSSTFQWEYRTARTIST